MHKYDITVTASASPEVIWKLLVDAASWLLWSKVDSLDKRRSVGLDPGGDDGVGEKFMQDMAEGLARYPGMQASPLRAYAPADAFGHQ